MTRGWRAFYGAAIGALLVLFAHPLSRSFLITALTQWGSSEAYSRSDLILANHAILPVPKKLLDAGLWMEVGSERLMLHQYISDAELRTMLQVASYASSQDPDNAYWKQMVAVFDDALGRRKSIEPADRARYRQAALAAWLTASNLSRWDDYQSQRLGAIKMQLASESGGEEAWQYAAVYPLRLTDAGACIDSYSRELLRTLDLKTPSSLLLRYATLLNGKLLRDGARSIEIGELGAGMVERATYPSSLTYESTPRALVLGRTRFYNTLVHEGFVVQAHRSLEVFNSNEAWLALVDESNLGNQTPKLLAASVLTIDLPGALLATAGFGGAAWLLSLLFERKPKLLRIVQPPAAPVIGALLAVALYAVTGLGLAALATVACFGFLALTPNHERTQAPKQLGPIFELTIFFLSLVLAIFLCAFFIGLSTPGCQILPAMGIAREFYGGSSLMLALTIVVLALMLLAAPAWAMAQRIATPKIVVLTLCQFGRGLFLSCLALAIIATPLCAIGDQFLSNRLGMIVKNEPLYYQLNE